MQEAHPVTTVSKRLNASRLKRAYSFTRSAWPYVSIGVPEHFCLGNTGSTPLRRSSSMTASPTPS